MDDIEVGGLQHQSDVVKHFHKRKPRIPEKNEQPAIAASPSIPEPGPPSQDRSTAKDDEEDHGRKSLDSNPETSKRAKRSLIIPGTNWCGVGNVSKDNEELGRDVGVDRCCRQHDYCPHTIERFTRKYGLYNYRYYTVSHCDCDNMFRSCLRAAFNEEANIIGELYFNYIGMRCFVFVRGTVCAERAWWGLCQRESVEWTAELKDATKYEKLQA
jgi:secretory phospholipase A2